jgi:hypothetical protein
LICQAFPAPFPAPDSGAGFVIGSQTTTDPAASQQLTTPQPLHSGHGSIAIRPSGSAIALAIRRPPP